MVAATPSHDATSSGAVGATSCVVDGSPQRHASRIHGENSRKPHHGSYGSGDVCRNAEFSWVTKWLVFSRLGRRCNDFPYRTRKRHRRPRHAERGGANDWTAAVWARAAKYGWWSIVFGLKTNGD